MLCDFYSSHNCIYQIFLYLGSDEPGIVFLWGEYSNYPKIGNCTELQFF